MSQIVNRACIPKRLKTAMFFRGWKNSGWAGNGNLRLSLEKRGQKNPKGYPKITRSGGTTKVVLPLGL
jgi:hypothetical protein